VHNLGKRVIHNLFQGENQRSKVRDTDAMKLEAVTCIDSPVGTLALGATELGIAEVSILTAGQRRAEFSNSAIAQSHLTAAQRQLFEFFKGTRNQFELPLDLSGTTFQRSVWAAISELKSGEHLSYKGLAQAIGKPLAARAVGGAVGSNPVPIIIGCHRILGAANRLTGYSGGGGLETKKWLLDFEGIEYAP
jgi:methylated-DNA-[protein]-cysteine S-methyltransferase